MVILKAKFSPKSYLLFRWRFRLSKSTRQGLNLSEAKILSTPPTGSRRLLVAFWESGGPGRGQDNFFSLKADKPQVGQRHEDVERIREYYISILFLKVF